MSLAQQTQEVKQDECPRFQESVWGPTGARIVDAIRREMSAPVFAVYHGDERATAPGKAFDNEDDAWNSASRFNQRYGGGFHVRQEGRGEEKPQEQVNPAQRNTGCCTTHCRPTLGEMVQSSRDAADTYRARLAADPDCLRQVEGLKKTLFDLAEYEILAERFGAQTKLHRVSGRDIAEARVQAFLRMTAQEVAA